MNFQEIAEEMFQEVLLHKNLFISHTKLIQKFTSAIEQAYNRGYDAGQDSINNPPAETEEAKQSREAKLDAIMAEVQQKLKAEAIVSYIAPTEAEPIEVALDEELAEFVSELADVIAEEDLKGNDDQ